MELLLITENENKHYVLMKDFNRLCLLKQNIRIKNTSVFNVLVPKKS